MSVIYHNTPNNVMIANVKNQNAPNNVMIANNYNYKINNNNNNNNNNKPTPIKTLFVTKTNQKTDLQRQCAAE